MKKTGFTIVEIMIVVAIVGLLTSIAIPAFFKHRSVVGVQIEGLE
jgi:prepilin-type N-terminal cleavage/methylation domain-containing protein